MNKIFYSICLMLLWMTDSVAQSNAVAIQKRWMMTDVVGDKAKKERYEKEFAKHIREMELKQGKFFIYENGVLEAEAKYTMAPDGKSFLVLDGMTRVSVKIVSLKGDVLQAVAFGFLSNKDTIIYKVSTPALAKARAAKANASGWNNIMNAWNNVTAAHQKRIDLATNFIALVKANGGIDEKTIEKFTAAKIKAAAINVKPENLTAKSINEYQQVQAEVRSTILAALLKAEQNNELKNMPAMQEIQQQLEGIENSINVARYEYNNSVAVYNAAARQNNTPQKDIAFKADAGSEKAPQIKF